MCPANWQAFALLLAAGCQETIQLRWIILQRFHGHFDYNKPRFNNYIWHGYFRHSRYKTILTFFAEKIESSLCRDFSGGRVSSWLGECSQWWLLHIPCGSNISHMDWGHSCLWAGDFETFMIFFLDNPTNTKTYVCIIGMLGKLSFTF